MQSYALVGGIPSELMTNQFGPCVGRVVSLSPTGQAMVDFPGNPSGPVFAKSIITLAHDSLSLPIPMPAVLLVFEENDVYRPIVVGVVRDEFIAKQVVSTSSIENGTSANHAPPKKIVMEADEKIEFKCGKSSIELNRDGKVLIRGTQIVSRASRTNRIKGGSVAIN